MCNKYMDIDNLHPNSLSIQEIGGDDVTNDDNLGINGIDVGDGDSNVIEIDGLDILLGPDCDDIVTNEDEIPSLIFHTSNVDDGSSGDEASVDDLTIDDDTIDGNNGSPPLIYTPDDDIDNGEDDFASDGYKPPKWSPFTNGYGKALQLIYYC